jgi:YD repeat-containing protein
MTQKSYSDGTPAVSYTYDTGASGYPIGRLTQVSNANAATNYTSYDGLGRATGSTQSQGGQVYSFSYAYNLAGSLTSETYPSGRIIATGYDGANRASSVTGTFNQAQTNYLSNATYSPHGAPTGYTYGNSSMPGFTYNNRLQPNQVYSTLSNGYFLYYLWLNWGDTTNNGNLLQLDEEVSTAAAPYSSLTTYGQNYGYDAVNRLVSASDSGGWTRNFAYDQYGNGWVTGWTGIGLALMEPTSGTLYNTKNQIGSSPYDANGNMTALPPGMTFVYDAENRQTSESNSDGMSATYLYDGNGRRVEKALASGQTTIYVYDAKGDLAAEYDKNPPAPMCRTCYLNYDHLGSVRLVTDQNASIIARHSYLPFGEEVPGGSAGRGSQFDASDNVSQRFTGKSGMRKHRSIISGQGITGREWVDG